MKFLKVFINKNLESIIHQSNIILQTQVVIYVFDFHYKPNFV